NHETTNLETLQTDIYETQNEITNLLTEMDEGKVSDVDEKVSAIGQDLEAITKTYSASVKEFKTIWNSMSVQDKAKYEEILNALEDVQDKTEAQSLLFLEQNKTNETLDRMQEQSNASFEQMQKQTSDSLEKMQDRTNDSLSQIQEQNKTGLQELSDKLEVLESAQSDESRLSSQRDELLHQKIDEIMTHERQTDEDIQSVFRSVSNGKCTLATSLLTNGFTVADLRSEDVEDKAPLVPFLVYADSIHNGISILREKTKDYLSEDDAPTTIEEISQSIDEIADKKSREGYDAGFAAGKSQGKSEGEQIGYNKGVTYMKTNGSGYARRTTNYFFQATPVVESTGLHVFDDIYLKNTSNKNELIMLDPAYTIGNTGTIQITNGVQFADMTKDTYEPLGILFPNGVLTCRVFGSVIEHHLVIYELSVSN
ncbi:MAG: hypothetical protein K5853_03150, partial [Lachnospiraceae bacterium]|nr:hypothetical protein [Lachnospiraceae bacterium]